MFKFSQFCISQFLFSHFGRGSRRSQKFGLRENLLLYGTLRLASYSGHMRRGKVTWYPLFVQVQSIMGYHYIKLLAFFVTLTSASQSISLVKDGCHQSCPVGMMMRRISSTLSCLSNTLHLTSHLFLWSLLIAWNELIQTISDITGGQRSARTSPSLIITGSASPCWGTFPLQVSSSYVEPPSVQFFFSCLV